MARTIANVNINLQGLRLNTDSSYSGHGLYKRLGCFHIKEMEDSKNTYRIRLKLPPLIEKPPLPLFSAKKQF